MAQQFEASQYPADDEIDLMEIMRVLFDSKWLIISVTLISTFLAGLYAFTATPIYRAEAIAYEASHGEWLAKAEISPVGIIAPVSANDLNTAILTMKSRQFLTVFIQKHQIEQHLSPVPDGKKAYELFEEILSVSKNRKGEGVKVAIQWHNPTQAATWVNILIADLDTYLRELAITNEEKSIGQIKQLLSQTAGNMTPEWQNEIIAILNAKKNNVALFKANANHVLQIIDPAIPPTNYVKPKKKVIVIMGLLLGLTLGALLVFGKNTYSKYQTKNLRST